MKQPVTLLLVDDDPDLRAALAPALMRRSFVVAAASCGGEAITLLRARHFEVVLLDLALPDVPGEELLDALRRIDPELEVVILTGHGTLHSAVQCTRRGAFDYIAKPPDVNRLAEVLEAAARRRRAKLVGEPAVPAEDEALHLF
jgi:two-component system response regulator AtoC